MSRRYLTASLTIAALLLAGCGGSQSEAKDVRLITHDSFSLPTELIAEFERETGYKLVVTKAGDAGTLVAGAVLTAGNPTADVLYGVDNVSLAKALDGGVFVDYQSKESAALDSRFATDSRVTAVDFGDVCVNYDIDYFRQRKLDPPASLADLVSPKYANLLVVEDPGTSSPGTAFLLATIANDPDHWQSYWEQLQANGVKVVASWDDAYYTEFTKGGGSGQRPLVVSYASSPPAEIIYAEEPKPTTVSTGVMRQGCYRQVEYAGVLAGAANTAGAQALVDWLVSKRVQDALPLSMFVYPTRTDARLPEVFTKFASVVEQPLQLPSSEVSSNLADWLSQWDSLNAS